MENKIISKQALEKELAKKHLSKLFRRFKKNPHSSAFIELERFMFVWQQMEKSCQSLHDAQLDAEQYIQKKYEGCISL